MMANKAERDYMSRVAELGCIVCADLGYESEAEVHHIGNQAMGKRASNYNTIPLCADHHRNGGYGIAVHAGRKEWEKRHGTEKQLLAKVKGLLCQK